MTATPDWHPDPTGRYERRYWNGSAWSEHVLSGSQQGTDPIVPPPTPEPRPKSKQSLLWISIAIAVLLLVMTVVLVTVIIRAFERVSGLYAAPALAAIAL